jgi:hypothetical protein
MLYILIRVVLGLNLGLAISCHRLGIVPRLGQGFFLPDPCPFICKLSTLHDFTSRNVVEFESVLLRILAARRSIFCACVNILFRKLLFP